MKKEYDNGIITVLSSINNDGYFTEYFTSIRKINQLIHLLVCAGFNEDEDNTNIHQAWTRTNIDNEEVSFIFEQHMSNFDAYLKARI